jgi:uncharacterized protein (TIGR00661 family)
MSRILYGVMGDAGGHVSEALTISQEMPEHEFLFLGGGRAKDIKTMGYNVEELPMLSAFYRGNRVDIPSTLTNATKVLFNSSTIRKRVVSIINEFDPDIILSGYEFFTALGVCRT